MLKGVFKGVTYICKGTKAGKRILQVVKSAKSTQELTSITEKVGGKVIDRVPRSINFKDVKLVTEQFLKKNGINPHLLKEQCIGKKTTLKHFDIYKHSKTGELIIFKKGGKGIPIPTGSFIK